MQGGPLPPLLANILLDDFDKELESRGLRFVRYADDFLVFTKTRQAARRVFASIERYLTRKLKLVVKGAKATEKGDRSNFPERPGGCCGQIGDKLDLSPFSVPV